MLPRRCAAPVMRAMCDWGVKAFGIVQTMRPRVADESGSVQVRGMRG
jgi:hypothetical protein